MSDLYDLIVIGAGPGGYVAAIRAAQLGMKCAVVEREAKLGGTCLRIGCIPSKALLETTELFEQSRLHFAERGIVAKEVTIDLPQMMQYKEGVIKQLNVGIGGLLKKNKVEHYCGHGQFKGNGQLEVASEDKVQTLKAKNFLIATGSVSSSLPGIGPDRELIGTSTEALSWPEVPKRLVVIGAGVIGLELGTVWRRLGSEVTVLEYLPRILPGTDSQIATEAQKLFEKQGLKFRLNMKVTSVTSNGKLCTTEMDGQEPLHSDRVLVSVGRRPCTDNLGLESVEVKTDRRVFVQVNSSYQTTAAGIYAIGDVIGGAMLAHKAEEEGIACVERLATGHGHINYQNIPDVIYTSPEIASVGMTEDALKEQGTPYRSGKFTFAANGRARAAGHTDGFVKILANRNTDRVLGVHILGAHAGELIAEAAVAMEFGASSEDIARSCHAHPTLAEAIKEAALAVDQRAIHS